MRCGVGHMSSWAGHDKMVHVGGLGKVLALVRLNWSTSTSSGYPLGVIHAVSRVSCETFHSLGLLLFTCTLALCRESRCALSRDVGISPDRGQGNSTARPVESRHRKTPPVCWLVLTSELRIRAMSFINTSMVGLASLGVNQTCKLQSRR